MPRNLSGMGRYPPQPRYQPFAFYTAVSARAPAGGRAAARNEAGDARAGAGSALPVAPCRGG